MKVVIVPGNGDGDVTKSCWYFWVKRKLGEDSIECILQNMPDPVVARESVWLPFMENELGCDSQTVIVGHSSGAEAAMRYAERHQVLGIVLVAACCTDLGNSNEKASGYYDRPWEWGLIKKNCQWIIQFAGSTDDPFIAMSEQQEVARSLNSMFYQFTDKGHFCDKTFPKLVKTLVTQLK